ncbi:MAG: HDOD domain-containing protein [bacterium]
MTPDEAASDTEEKLKGLVKQVKDLPTLPSVVTQIIKMVEDPDTSAADMNQVISQDPSLTAKVLKLVNSAFYGFSRQISTVREAVVILGFNRVKSLALSASVFEVFQGEGVDKFDRVGLWEHSIGTGVAAEILGKRIRYPNPEEILVVGILHNIGKIVIDLYFHDELREIFKMVRDRNCQMLEAERKILGVGHPRIGSWLTEQWNLPEQISQSIRHYPEPLDAPQEYKTLPMLIHVGDIFARTKNIGWTGDDVIPPFQEDVMDELDLSKEDIPELLEELEQEMQNAEVFLELSDAVEEGGEDG